MVSPGITNDFKLAILEGVHQPGDVYMLALYMDDLTEQTSVYTAAGEIQGQGYKAGGTPLAGRQSVLSGNVGLLTWADAVWPIATIAARAALVYNRSKDNRTVAVLDLGKVVTSTNGPFSVLMPPIESALVQIG